MKNFKDARRRMKQQALQALGAAEATEDTEFKEDLSTYKNTCRAVRSLRKSMATHLEAVRHMQATASALAVELAAFHQDTEAAKSTVAFGQCHAELERVQLCSVERLYEEEVKASTELLLWQVPEVEEKVRHRKKLLLDYDAHLRKYENLSKQELTEPENGKKKKAIFGRRKTDDEVAEELAQRKLKVEEAEEAVDQSTKWLMEQFQEMEEKRQSGRILEGPMSALLACQLHMAKESLRRLEALQGMFESVDIFASTLDRYDKEPPKNQELDVEGFAHMTNLAPTRSRKMKKKKGGNEVFGVPLTTSTPSVVCDCIMFIRNGGLETEGLFRVPGHKDTVDMIKARYDSGEKGVLNVPGIASIHDACTLLKQWLRELPEPLIPSEFYGPLMEILREDLNVEKGKTVTSTIQLVQAMPKEHSELLGLLANFLNDVAKYESENRMSAANLATCFAPSVMRAPEETPPNEVLRDMQAAIAAVKVFISHAAKLPQPKRKQVKACTCVEDKLRKVESKNPMSESGLEDDSEGDDSSPTSSFAQSELSPVN